MLEKSKSIIGIACGGYGSERNISLKSGELVLKTLKKAGWNVFLLIIDFKDWYLKISETEKLSISRKNLSYKLNEVEYNFDVIFNALHGSPGEDGQLAAILDAKKIPHTSCNYTSAALTYNKRDCLSEVKKYNIPTAKSFHLNEGDHFKEENIIEKVGLPCFVKASRAGSSFGIYRITNIDDLKAGITNAFKEDSQIIIESELKGKEVSVGVYKKKNDIICLPITEIISENDFFDYEAKYQGKAQEITPANISDEMLKKVYEMAVLLYNKLNLKGICRSEFIFIGNTPHLLEINTVPGLTSESIIPKQCKAAGIMLHELFEDLLDQAIIKNS
tara:strand:+ start:5636 stop:6631 length:996 start_codon:yes stop_codon:yes gene_type:complete